MPFNLLKQYNSLLELIGLNEHECKLSLKNIFKRDFEENNLTFHGKNIFPTPQENDEISMETLFRHLTTEVSDSKTKKRIFEINRSQRLHWVRYLLEEKKKTNILLFSVKEARNLRTYYYDRDEEYVIVLEPLRNKEAYYLLSAFKVRGKDATRNKIEKKYKRRLNEIL